MRCLLDTQVMLWWLLDDPRLGAKSRELLASKPCLMSVASIWEVAIKHRIGKLEVSPIVFRDQSIAAGFAPVGREPRLHGSDLAADPVERTD